MDFKTETRHLGSVTDNPHDNYSQKLADVPETDSGLISVQLLQFKTSLLEAVEELHIHRDAETRHEAQICKLVLEKQELEWHKESLQNQINRLTNEQSESLAVVQKQFQAQIEEIEGDKAKYQLSVELKDKEIASLKEELKSLQLFKYSLEKKLSELDQKVQLQTQVKDSHLNQLEEVEKRFRMISRQCAVVKQDHEKLEQNVEEAMRSNRKLADVNKKQESEITTLKKDVERLNSELVKSKVMSVCKSGDDSSSDRLKNQRLHELQQRLIVETELNKKLRSEIAVERAEKQELISSLQHAQCLLQTQTQAVCRTEQQLLVHTEEYQVLKREHEMVRERSKEKEDRLVHLIDDYKRSRITLEKEMETLHVRMRADQEELKAGKKAYDDLHEKHQQLSSSMMNQARRSHGLEDGLKDDFEIQTNSPTSLNCDTDLDKDGSLDREGRQASPQNNREQMRHRKEDEDIPDERAAECQEAAIGGENDEVNVRSQMDRTTLALPPSEGLDALAPDQSQTSKRVSGADVTNQQIDPAVKQEASVSETSAPVLGVRDNGHPSDSVQSYTESRLTVLSQSQTRSVYGVASDPVMSELGVTPAEKSLCVYETRERQTPDKHTSETFQDVDLKGDEPQTVAPEINKASRASPNNDSAHCVTELVVFVEEGTEPRPVHNKSPAKHRLVGIAYSGPQKLIVPRESGSSHEGVSSAPCSGSISDTPQRGPDHQSTSEDLNNHVEVSKANHIPETEMNTISGSDDSSFQSTGFITDNVAEAQDGNKTDDICTSALSSQSNEQNAETSPDPQIPNPQEDTKLNEQLNNAEKQIPGLEPGYSKASKIHGSSPVVDMSFKDALDVQLNGSQSAAVVQTSESSAPLIGLLSEQKSVLPSGFQDLLRPFCTPGFPKSTLGHQGGTTDKTNVPDIRLNRKTDHYGEWCTIKETFSEIFVEKESRMPISFGSAQPGSPAALSVGNGLRQNCTVTPPPRRPGLGKVSRPKVCEERTPTHLEKEDHQKSDIRAQIAKIEQFLSSESLRPQKRRRVDEA